MCLACHSLPKELEPINFKVGDEVKIFNPVGTNQNTHVIDIVVHSDSERIITAKGYLFVGGIYPSDELHIEKTGKFHVTFTVSPEVVELTSKYKPNFFDSTIAKPLPEPE